VDAFNQIKGVAQFEAWARSNKSSVRVLKRKYETSGSFLDSDKYHLWALFEVTKPTPRWEPTSTLLPFPTRAKATGKGAVKSKADTEQRPPKKSVKEYWKDEAADLALGGLSGVGILLIFYLVSQSTKRN
jgi:hypothetical protein